MPYYFSDKKQSNYKIAMTLRYLIQYMISDFLLDQKAELDRLDILYKEEASSGERAEIMRLRAHVHNRGLQALKRYKRRVPKCVKEYYLGYRKDKPGVEEISAGRGEKPEECPRCGNFLREIPAGVSRRTGQPYQRFWACESLGCGFTYNEGYNKSKDRKKRNERLVFLVIIALILLAIFL